MVMSVNPIFSFIESFPNKVFGQCQRADKTHQGVGKRDIHKITRPSGDGAEYNDKRHGLSPDHAETDEAVENR